MLFFDEEVIYGTLAICGWLVMVFVNTLCLLRLGILPMIFFGRNYKEYALMFCFLFVTIVFLLSEIMLIRMLVNVEVFEVIKRHFNDSLLIK